MLLDNSFNKTLIIFNGELFTDPRPTRIYNFLIEYNIDVDVCCDNIKNTNSSVTYIKIPTYKKKYTNLILKTLRLFPNDKFKNLINNTLYNHKLLKKNFEFKKYTNVFVFDIYLLQFVIDNIKSHKYIFDAREYYPKQFDDKLAFKIFEMNERYRICKSYLNKCDHVYTVSNYIRNEYINNFLIKCDLILSLPYFSNLEPIFNEGPIKVVHHGMANRNRKIENLCEIFKSLNNNLQLHLYLVGDLKYIKELQTKYQHLSNIYFHNKVDFNHIIPTLNKYDIGLIYFEPTTFNLKYCLPNKLFEYIQSKLMIVSGPSPEIKYITTKYNCGIISDEFSIKELVSIFENIKRDDIISYKLNSNNAAIELSHEYQKSKLKMYINIK
jgi:hypothetical protein